ncbi:ABC transporter ATP-binding protein [Streptomyces sp. NPDC015661]|uniref:ABC transporter ATP-binding protein n=1 Tax=Streptomyces sp. NPDC015661 TaxID=3364961 RepID=UPI0037010D27
MEFDNLTVSFGHGAATRTVLDAVSVGVPERRTVGLVGESGSGKSTLAKAALGLVRATGGTVRLDGRDLAALRRGHAAAVRRSVQLISQDPYASLDPRLTIGRSIAEAIDPVRADVRKHSSAVARWLETVALDPSAAGRLPHEFSGGQRQRIAIARALAAEPAMVIADEITSALDASVQAEVLNLLAALRDRLGLTMLFISHDLAVVRHVCDEVVVLRHGSVIEQGPTRDIYERPSHPYTRTLLASAALTAHQ